MMKMNGKMIIPILASIGVGAATFYSIRRNGNKNPVQQVTKMLNNQ